MTETPFPEPLEVLPMPPGAIELPASSRHSSPWAMAVAALHQGLSTHHSTLPFGPQSAAEDEGRLLSLNRFSLQLAIAGIGADRIAIDLRPWLEASTVPQLLLSAQVDEENDVVAFKGVLTGAELIALASNAERSNQQLLLETTAFKGGLQRLLTLVQLLEPQALPRLALASEPASPLQQVVAVADWLTGQLDRSLETLFGARWQPITQGAFFSAATPLPSRDALALVSIPLGLEAQQLVCADAAGRSMERFQLQMIATGSDPSRPDGLRLNLIAAMAGDLLPDGLILSARQGSHEQRQVASGSTQIELFFAASQDLITVVLSYPGSADLVLPPLQLPG
jgi:hypothetical protein